MRTILVALLMVALAACSNTGPRVGAILGDEDAVLVSRDVTTPYAVVDLTVETAQAATHLRRHAARTTFLPDGGAMGLAIGVGDEIEISIVSTSDVGFLDIANSSLSPISTTTLPPQTVASDGMVSVPPLGRVRAAGQSVAAFERQLTRRLAEVLVEPTAIVRLSDRQSAQVTLVGTVAAPGNYSLTKSSTRLIEAIATAGGPVNPADETMVRISRDGRTGAALLSEIYARPAYNIRMRPGDIVTLEAPGFAYTVLGAGGRNANIAFNAADTTLANALGAAGGVLSARADPRGVFVYRLVPRNGLASLGITLSEQEASTHIPVIFRLDLRQPQSLFIADVFEIADSDVVYISDSFLSSLNATFRAISPFVPAPSQLAADAVIN